MLNFFRSILFFTAIMLVIPAYSYKDKRAIILVNKQSQPDSLGYNLVTSFSDWVYTKLATHTIKLYDSPRKTSEISFPGLLNMEKSSGASFTDISNLFIYETWNSDKKSTSFSIHGIAFTSESTSGNEVNFGYIDFNEISDLLKNEYIPVTVDGRYNTTFFQVFMNKEFVFDLIFFDQYPIPRPGHKNQVKELKRALEIEKNAFNAEKINLNYIPVQNAKKITYSLRTFDYNINTENIIAAVEDYFKNDRRELEAYAGDVIPNYFRKNKLIITECSLNELWVRQEGSIFMLFLDITPKFIDLPFNKLNAKDISNFGLKVDSLDFATRLQKKDFLFHITMINDNPIDENLSELYFEALQKHNWNNISTYVRTNKK